MTHSFGSLRVDLQPPSPYRSLQSGQWVKLICGASYQDMPTIRRLVMLYALAGVDCVDVAADAAVVAAARQGLADARQLAQVLGDHHHLAPDLPWLMISLNDSEDPHFRKAYFDAVHCPSECDRPCETQCPTAAIQFAGVKQGGVISNLCYGCGRCIDLCPIDNIRAQFHQAKPEDFSDADRNQVDAIEIHTQAGRQTEFIALWQRLEPWKRQLKLISISCPDDPQIVAYLQDLYAIMAPLDIPLIWQTDGRPMSGDLGKGTTHATIRLAQKILAAELPGYVQLAGGTNHYTLRKLSDLGLVQFPALAKQGLVDSHSLPQTTLRTVAGIAYGSYARTLVMPMLEEIDQELETFFDAMSPEADASYPQVFDKLGLVCTSSGTKSMFEIDNTSTLMVGLNQARQLVRALKRGGV